MFLHTYDDENRLTSMVEGTMYRTDFPYDGLSRVRTRTEHSWLGSGWAVSSVTQYLYDGIPVTHRRVLSNGQPHPKPNPGLGQTRRRHNQQILCRGSDRRGDLGRLETGLSNESWYNEGSTYQQSDKRI